MSEKISVVPVDMSDSIPNRYARSVASGSGSGSGEPEPSPCTGPTAYEDGNGDCQCANIRGMTLEWDECACNGTANMEWDESEGACVCDSTTQVRKLKKTEKNFSNLTNTFS